MDNPINNRKVAKYLGSSFKPSQVKMIKRLYIRKMRKRARENHLPVKDMIRKDIEDPNLKNFFIK